MLQQLCARRSLCSWLTFQNNSGDRVHSRKKSSIWLMFHSSSIGFHLLHFVYHDSFRQTGCRASTMVGVAWWGSILGTPTTWIRTIRIQQSSRNAWSGSRIKDLRNCLHRWVPWLKGMISLRLSKENKKMCSFVCRTFFSKTCENGYWVAVQMENEGKWLWMTCPSKKANCKKL